MLKTTWRAPSCRDLMTAIAILSLAACNTRSPIEENATSPTAPTTTVITPPGATPVSSLFSVDLTPKAIVGGGVARGVLTLSFPAPPGGAVVTLSSGDATVAVPASITVPAGAETWMFTESGAWTLRVAAPPGQQLRPGKYVNAPWAPTTGLFFSLSGPGRGCSTSMTDFEVLEAVYATPPPASSPLVTGIVERFHTTFTHRCNPTAAPLNGEISIRALVPNRCNTPSGSC